MLSPCWYCYQNCWDISRTARKLKFGILLFRDCQKNSESRKWNLAHKSSQFRARKGADELECWTVGVSCSVSDWEKEEAARNLSLKMGQKLLGGADFWCQPGHLYVLAECKLYVLRRCSSTLEVVLCPNSFQTLLEREDKHPLGFCVEQKSSIHFPAPRASWCQRKKMTLNHHFQFNFHCHLTKELFCWF